MEPGIFTLSLKHFSGESRSNTKTAGEDGQKRPIQQKILKPGNTNPAHYRQTSLANHTALRCNMDDCAFSLSDCVCVCLASGDLSRGFQRKANTRQNLNAKMQRCNICQQKAKREQSRLHRHALELDSSLLLLLLFEGLDYLG